MLIGAIVAVLIIVFDQLSKFLVYGSEPFSVIGNFLWFESTFNTGVAFSLFEDSTLFFTIVSAVASVVLIYFLFSKKFLKEKFQKISIAILLGGTISNFFDRLFLGGVRDFISLKFMNFAIFNVADMAIVIGAILLCISVLVPIIKEEKVKKDKINSGIERQNAKITNENIDKGTKND